jgi:hypothetical protein
MPKAQKTELAGEATHPEGAEPFGPPRPPTIAELAERGRKVRGEKPLQSAFAEALNDLFDAYLYTLTHPCEVSPHELLALINTHREVMAVHREAQQEAQWLGVQQEAPPPVLHNFRFATVVSRRRDR